MTTKENKCGVCHDATNNETDAYGYEVRVCDICANREDWSYGELADFTHPLQVAVFGWCSCEDNEGNENPYADCPKGVFRAVSAEHYAALEAEYNAALKTLVAARNERLTKSTQSRIEDRFFSALRVLNNCYKKREN